MTSIPERIMSLWSFTSKSTPIPPPTPPPKTSIYDERIACFKILTHLQKQMKFADEQASIEDKPNENASQTFESYTQEYKKEYELCEKIMKY